MNNAALLFLLWQYRHSVNCRESQHTELPQAYTPSQT